MAGQATFKRHTVEERQRVLDGYRSGDDWRAVAAHNAIPRTSAYNIVASGRVEPLPRGGPRHTKMTPEIKVSLEAYMEECYSYTLSTMHTLVLDDHNVELSLSTISRHLLGMLYTVKQTRVEPIACNSEVNKEKRKVFAEALIAHHTEGNLVVYFDETNFNLYTKRSRGRAKKGKRAIDVLPASKGPNIQIQCAVSSVIGVVKTRTQRGSIKMHENAAFVDEIYDAVKEMDVYKDTYAGKKIVVVFDNAPAHSQTGMLVSDRDDLVLLRLGPYSPMRNPIENAEAVLKGHIKDYLALCRREMGQRSVLLEKGRPVTMKETNMRLLERAAHVSMTDITQQLVMKMELHARDFVNAVVRLEDMRYGK